MIKSALILAAIGFPLQIWLIGALGKRRLFRVFPFFSAYAFSAVVIGIIKLAVVHNYAVYFWVFWCAEILYAVLALCALYEAFQKLFDPFLRIYSRFRLIFPVAVALCACLPVSHALKEPLNSPRSFVDFMLSLEFGMGILQCGLFGVFLAVKQILKLQGRTYSWGIVEGFAATALGGLTYGARSGLGNAFLFVAKYAAPMGYILAVLLWLDTFTRGQQDAIWQLGTTPEQLITEVNNYTTSLRQFLERKRT
ncbi:MAG TPA: hypothetical protein VFY05_12435 [Candidatus Angelobacter sp.]|nr:hypothetical protein [Candidatus Angelobacter sp.]